MTHSADDIVAAIDIGTNSTNLRIVSRRNGIVDSRITVTRLGQDVDQNRSLSEEAMQRVISCLADYRQVLDTYDSYSLRVVASSACRDASNREEFFTRVEKTIGVQPELLSGQDEGRLAYQGCASNLVLDPVGHLIIDIGGGSTEIMLGTTQLDIARSIDVGAVRITERHLRRDPPAPEELLNAIGEVQDLFEDLLREFPDMARAPQIIGTAGTIITVAAVEIGQRVFDPQGCMLFVSAFSY